MENSSVRGSFPWEACPKVHVRTAKKAEKHLGVDKQVGKKNHLLSHRPNIPLRTLAFGFTQSEVHIRLTRQ